MNIYHLLADSYYPLSPLPGLNTQSTNLTDYLTSVFTVTISVAAMLAVIMIVFGGFQYLTREASADKDEGRKRITQALLGLLLLLGSYLILKVIDPNILKLDLFKNDLDTIGKSSSGSGNVHYQLPQATSPNETPR